MEEDWRDGGAAVFEKERTWKSGRWARPQEPLPPQQPPLFDRERPQPAPPQQVPEEKERFFIRLRTNGAEGRSIALEDLRAWGMALALEMRD